MLCFGLRISTMPCSPAGPQLRYSVRLLPCEQELRTCARKRVEIGAARSRTEDRVRARRLQFTGGDAFVGVYRITGESKYMYARQLKYIAEVMTAVP